MGHLSKVHQNLALRTCFFAKLIAATWLEPFQRESFSSEAPFIGIGQLVLPFWYQMVLATTLWDYFGESDMSIIQAHITFTYIAQLHHGHKFYHKQPRYLRPRLTFATLAPCFSSLKVASIASWESLSLQHSWCISWIECCQLTIRNWRRTAFQTSNLTLENLQNLKQVLKCFSTSFFKFGRINSACFLKF